MSHDLLQEEINETLRWASSPAPDAVTSTGAYRGRKASPLHAKIDRALTPDDLLVLQTTDLGSTTPPLQSIRGSHHRLARLLALGQNKNAEIAEITGFSPSRISILLQDPTFSALVEHYRQNVQAVFVDHQERLKGLSLDAMDVLMERLHETPDEFTNDMLLKILTQAADRSGAGPTQKVEGRMLHAIVSDDRLHKIKEVVDGNQQGKVKSQEKEGKIQPRLPNHTTTSDSQALQAALFCQGAEDLEGDTSEGEYVRAESWQDSTEMDSE